MFYPQATLVECFIDVMTPIPVGVIASNTAVDKCNKFRHIGICTYGQGVTLRDGEPKRRRSQINTLSKCWNACAARYAIGLCCGLAFTLEVLVHDEMLPLRGQLGDLNLLRQD